eukprot:3517630-Rhodomonas_salina.2
MPAPEGDQCRTLHAVRALNGLGNVDEMLPDIFMFLLLHLHSLLPVLLRAPLPAWQASPEAACHLWPGLHKTFSHHVHAVPEKEEETLSFARSAVGQSQFVGETVTVNCGNGEGICNGFGQHNRIKNHQLIMIELIKNIPT